MHPITRYLEKGPGLHLAIARAGHVLVRRGGLYLADDPAAVQAIVDAYDPLPEAQQAAKARVDAAAGAARARHITVAPGQEAVYLIKEAEARAYLADATEGALLAAEAAALGLDVAAAAQAIVARATAWRSVAATIEGLRLGAKAAIDAAADRAACGPLADAAVAGLEAV